MGKYDPLHRFLMADAVLPLTLSFAQVEQIIGAALPPAAFADPAWWGNEQSPTHEHAVAWLAAGLRASPDQRRQRVTFSR